MTKEEKFAQIINPKAFVGVKKDEFKRQFKGKLRFDLNEVWDWIVKNRGSKPKSED